MMFIHLHFQNYKHETTAKRRLVLLSNKSMTLIKLEKYQEAISMQQVIQEDKLNVKGIIGQVCYMAINEYINA